MPSAPWSNNDNLCDLYFVVTKASHLQIFPVMQCVYVIPVFLIQVLYLVYTYLYVERLIAFLRTLLLLFSLRTQLYP